VRRLFILALLALLLGVAFVGLVDTGPGYLLLAYGDYTLETSLWIGLVGVALLAALLYALLAVLARLLGSPGAIAFWLGGRRRRRAARLTQRGLVNFVEGNWKQSRRQLQRGARHADTPAFNYLMSARAGLQLADQRGLQQDLEAALDAAPQAGAAVDLLQAELQIQRAEYQAALDSLDRARDAGARSAHLLRLRSQALLGQSDWEGLQALLPELGKHKVFPPQELARLRRETAQRLLEVAAGDLGDNTLASLHRAWKKTAADLQAQESVLLCYVNLLARVGATDEALTLLTQSLKKAWSPALVARFGCLAGRDPQAQLAQAEAWLAQRPRDAGLLLCLGRLAARQSLWGQARDYFERSVSLEPSEEACAELGRLLAASGDYLQASRYFCAGLAIRDEALPELPMPEEEVPADRRISLDIGGQDD
jgi:HemY protein